MSGAGACDAVSCLDLSQLCAQALMSAELMIVREKVPEPAKVTSVQLHLPSPLSQD